MSESVELFVNGFAEHGAFRLRLNERIRFAGVLGLFGPSGSGKTTLLRAVAGLDQGFTGTISFAGNQWQDSAAGQRVPAWRRSVGFVFQQPVLFPHLDVGANLDYAIKRQPVDRKIASFDDIVGAMNVGGLLDRQVTELSGGEQQRVAISRVLLSAPKLMLLDEPLSALDRNSRNDIIPYLDTLFRQFDIPAIYVSHSVSEIARLAHDVVVLRDGLVASRGGVHEVLGDIVHVVDSEEPVSVLDVTIVEHDASLMLTHVQFGTDQLTLPRIDLRPGERARILVRSGDIVVATEAPSGLSVRNTLPGTITDVHEFHDSPFAIVTIDCNGASLNARLTRHAVNELNLEHGSAVFALVKTATFDRGA